MGVRVHATRCRAVLEADADVEIADSDARRNVLRPSLDEPDLDAATRSAKAPDGGGHDGCERAREHADAEMATRLLDGLAELCLGQSQPLGERIGVDEQQLPCLCQRETALAASDQLRPDLRLERTNVLRDRRLGQCKSLRRAREGAPMRDLPEREQAAWLENNLSL